MALHHFFGISVRAASIIVLILAAAISGFSQAQYDTAPQAQTGEQVYGSYFKTDIDSVSTFNGNLSLNIGLFSLPGRELSTGVAFTYNSQKWEQQICDDGNGHQIYCGNYTGGWQLSTGPYGQVPTFYYPGDGKIHIYWIDGNGTKKHYCCITIPGGDNQSIPSADSDGSVFFTGPAWSTGDPTQAYIAFKDGSRRYNSNSPAFVTANGNYISPQLGCGLYCSVPAQDTLGRSIQVQALGYSILYKITDANGVLQTYTVNYLNYSICDPWWDWYDWYPNYPGCTGIAQHWVNQSNISSITLPNGKSYAFEYNNPQGYLTKVTLPSGAYIRYVYATPTGEGPGYSDQVIQRIVSSDGTASSEKTWTYSGYAGLGTTASARTVTVTSPEGDKVVHTLNAQGLETRTQWQTSSGTALKTVTNSWSQATIYSNGQPQNPKVNTITTILDANLQSTKTITYDSYMNVTQEKVTDYGWGADPVVRQRDITYVNVGYPAPACNPGPSNFFKPSSETITAIDPSTGNFVQQGKTEYTYDEFTLLYSHSVPNQTDPTYNFYCRGNLNTVKRYKDATNHVDEHMYYDNLGNLVRKSDPLGHNTDIDFTDNFANCPSPCPTTFAYPKKVTNSLGQFTTTQYDYNTGLPKQVTNLRGYTTTTAYDLMNRVTSITEPNNKITTYAYDDTNRITTKEVTVDAANNKGHVETYFDKLYRVIRTRTNDPEGQIWVDAVYDGKGRKKQVSNPYRGVDGTIPCVGISLCTTTTYDALDRPTQVQAPAPDSSTVQYAYSNNQTTVTDEAGNQRRYTYNVFGQMATVEEPNPTLTNPVATTYSYYGFGPLYRSNQSGQLRTFVYNWLGQMTSQTLPESGTTTFAYDAAGRLSTKTDARNITVTMAYDNVNRPTSKTYSDSTPTVTSTYDANGYTGLKTSSTDGVGSVSYSYDNMDRLTQESRTLTGVSGTFSTSYSYNIKGGLTSMTYPSGRVVIFNYATGGGCCNSRLASVVDQTTSTTLNSSMNFNAAGELKNATLGNGVVQTFDYSDDRLQETSITATLGGTNLMSFSYYYGTSTTNTGRVLSRSDAIQPEHSATYYYDSTYRLSAVGSNADSKSWGLAWTFDTFGNRLTQNALGLAASKVGSPTSSYVNNRLQTPCFGQAGDCYDAAGNMINDAAVPTPHNYVFNAENRIVTVNGGASAGTTGATYAYDGEGRRMKKVTSTQTGTETTYTFYGPGGVISEFTTSNAIASATAAVSTDKCIYRTSDKLGSAVLVMNSSGVVIENNRTLPYGEAWLVDNAPSTNDRKFTTYQRDQESGLDYAMNRYYANTSARFVSVDKGQAALWAPQSLNRYAYVGNDPVNKFDRDGNEWRCAELFAADVSVGSICTFIPTPLPSLSGGSSLMGSWSIMMFMGWSGPQIPSPPTVDELLRIYAETALQNAMVRIGSYGKFANDAQRSAVYGALGIVANAFMTKPDCAGLFGGQFAALAQLSEGSFSYANTATRPPNVTDAAWGQIQALVTDPAHAGWATINGNTGFLNDRFFQSTPSGRATILIHELMHMSGKTAAEIDQPGVDGKYGNYGEVSQKCGTES